MAFKEEQVILGVGNYIPSDRMVVDELDESGSKTVTYDVSTQVKGKGKELVKITYYV